MKYKYYYFRSDCNFASISTSSSIRKKCLFFEQGLKYNKGSVTKYIGISHVFSAVRHYGIKKNNIYNSTNTFIYNKCIFYYTNKNKKIMHSICDSENKLL